MNQDYQLADKLIVRVPFGFDHVGIVVSTPLFGPMLVAHNPKGGCVEVVSLEQFAGGREVRVAAHVQGGWRVQQVVVERALELLGRPHDLLLFNCEHYVSLSMTGRAESPQLQGVFLALLLFGGIAILARE